MCCCSGRSSKEIFKLSLCIAIPIVIFLIIIGSLLGASAKDLHAVSYHSHQTNYGLEVNGNTNQVFQTLYKPGRYFLHLNHYFLEYTKQMHSIVFSSNYEDKRKISDPYTTITSGITARTRYTLIEVVQGSL